MAQNDFEKWRRWSAFLWPIAVGIVGTLVTPVAIEQYPELFKENPWILPLSIVVVLLLICLPLLLHQWVKRSLAWLWSVRYVGKGLAVIVPVIAVIAVVCAFGLMFRWHERHLATRLEAKNPKTLAAKVPPVQAPQLAPTAPEAHTSDAAPRFGVQLNFKASPLFTEQRRAHITTVVDDYCKYLATYGFDPPREFPPLGVTPGKSSGGGGEWKVGSVPSIYEETLLVGAETIDSPRYIKALYSRYIFEHFLWTHRSLDSRDTFEWLAALIFSNYFLADSSDTPPPTPRTGAPTDRWVSALWDIRQKHGRELVAKSLFYAFRRWDAPADTAKQENFDQFFWLRFLIGVNLEDNQLQHLASIREILKARGIHFE